MGESEHNRDISPLLRDWEYKPDEVAVRKVIGLDGRPKIQMRLPMGLIQMEIAGRPDGVRPEGHESYLEYYEARRQVSPEDFSLDPDDCARLRDEAIMYYQRYLSLFNLRDYQGVVRDTDRNLRVFDFVKNFADDSGDRLSLEQYRPYVLMMNARARAHFHLERQLRGKALEDVRAGIARIEEFFRELGREELMERSPELTVLRQLETEIKEHVPEAKLEDLRQAMLQAVAAEDYERAAQIRDEIRRLEKGA